VCVCMQVVCVCVTGEKGMSGSNVIHILSVTGHTHHHHHCLNKEAWASYSETVIQYLMS